MSRDGLLRMVFVAALALGAAAALNAQDDDDKEEPRLLTISAEGYVEVEPEIARISLGIEAVKPKPKEAATDVAQRANAVKAKLVELGVGEESVETSELYLGEATEYDYKRHRTIRQGYRAYHWLRVTLKYEDFDKLAAVVDGAVDAGASSFGGLRFEMEDDTALQAEALAKATANARVKAEAMAKAAGTSIVGVQSISEVQRGGWGAYEEEEEAAEAVMEDLGEPAEAVDFEEDLPGKLRISREVEVRFLLE